MGSSEGLLKDNFLTWLKEKENMISQDKWMQGMEDALGKAEPNSSLKSRTLQLD
jgi:hypothetical protein